MIAAALALALAMVVLGAITSPQSGCPPLRTSSTLVRATGHSCPVGNPLR